MAMNFFITVNNREIEAMKGETVLQALRRAGISVPTLCNMEGFTPTGACRLCMVEVAGREDLVPACSCPVEEWMDVQTHTPRVIKARKMIVELLLSGHPDDCLYCERNCHCELQDLAFELNIRERKHSGKKINKIKDLSSPAIIRDPAKCILCGRCVRVCEEVMGCTTLEFSGKGNASGITTTCNRSMNNSTCIACGQCVMVCPTSALYEKKGMAELQLALGNPGLYPVAVVDPVVTITLAEINGNRNVRQAARQLNSVLKRCGFREVYDYAALQDLYVLKSSELVLGSPGTTWLSSNCPSFVKFAEQQLHDLLPSVAPLRSPSQMAGVLIRKVMEKQTQGKQDAARPFVVSITPCTARKYEAVRKEFTQLPASEVDMAITTRTLEQLIRLNGLVLNTAETEEFSRPFHTSSLHGELGGMAGGTMEAVAATVYHTLTGSKELIDPKIKKGRVTKGVREITFTHQKKEYRFASVSGMAEAHRFLTEMQRAPGACCYIEVMACPGGCVNGGGQPITKSTTDYRPRQKQLLEMAEKNALTASYRNRTLDDMLSAAGLDHETLNALINTSFTKRHIV
jgi:NADH-quinone oxidoreductase subunit G/NADP-reducing hydrogenase subunit HndD